ncbi:MAG: hypothetical protein LBQ09_03465 [Acidobacteriaceae bacterium]|nr:hypothetical protein [Acidobacteriaceae bacterium]
MPSLTAREREEYRALRATIRERGTARVWIFVVGLALWAALVVAVAALASLPVATLLPLLFLTGVFEAVFALHTGVERVGRYVQVFYEENRDGESSTRTWEQVAMNFGRVSPGRGVDALFVHIFVLATVVNLVPAVLAGAVVEEWAVLGVVHALFIGRLVVARRLAAKQRALDLDAFRKLKESSVVNG